MKLVKKILEIFSDLPEPLLKNYSFFKGLSGGKLLLLLQFMMIMEATQN